MRFILDPANSAEFRPWFYRSGHTSRESSFTRNSVNTSASRSRINHRNKTFQTIAMLPVTTASQISEILHRLTQTDQQQTKGETKKSSVKNRRDVKLKMYPEHAPRAPRGFENPLPRKALTSLQHLQRLEWESRQKGMESKKRKLLAAGKTIEILILCKRSRYLPT